PTSPRRRKRPPPVATATAETWTSRSTRTTFEGPSRRREGPSSSIPRLARFQLSRVATQLAAAQARHGPNSRVAKRAPSRSESSGDSAPRSCGSGSDRRRTWAIERPGQAGRSADRTGVLVGRRQEDLDLLAQVRTTKRQVAHLGDDDDPAERPNRLRRGAGELGGAARTRGGRRHQPEEQHSRDDERTGDSSSHAGPPLISPAVPRF